MDIIFLRGLEIETVIGVYDWERTIRQTIVLDLELGTDIRAAAASDDLIHTVDYKAVCDRIAAFVAESSFFLVETLAERVAELVMEEFGVPWLRLTLDKRGALGGAIAVGLVIERGSRGTDA